MNIKRQIKTMRHKDEARVREIEKQRERERERDRQRV